LVSATIFLAIFSAIHMVSDAVSPIIKLPFLASSEAVWEHLKMAIYASSITIAVTEFAVHRRVKLYPLALGCIATVFSMFVLYYIVVSVTGELSRISLAIDLVVAIAVTWLSGLIGAITALESYENIERISSIARATVITIYALLVALTFTTTYIGKEIPLFKPP